MKIKLYVTVLSQGFYSFMSCSVYPVDLHNISTVASGNHRHLNRGRARVASDIEKRVHNRPAIVPLHIHPSAADILVIRACSFTHVLRSALLQMIMKRQLNLFGCDTIQGFFEHSKYDRLS